MNHNILSSAVVLLAATLGACSSGPKGEEEIAAVADSLRFTADLELYELTGPVRKVTKTTYYNVMLEDGRFAIDSLGTDTISAAIRFESDGHYRAKPDERIKRDEQGRIVRWEDRRPTAWKVPVGFAKDTMEYRRLNRNVMISDGMGVYAVMVYDENHRVAGQYTVPRMNKTYTSAINIYTAEDERGNWTERVTVWSTQGIKDSLPSLHYTIDRREILYYKDAE